MKRLRSPLVCAGLVLLLTLPLRADVVTTSDGSRFVGTIKEISGGTLVILTDIVGRLEIDMTKVTAIATQKSVNVAVGSGDTVVGLMDLGADGQGSVVHSELGDISVAASSITQLWPKGTDSPEVLAIRADAEKQIEAAKPIWKVTVEGGITSREGNTDSLDGHGSVKVDRKTADDLLQFYLRGKYHDDKNKRTENEYLGGIRYENQITGRSYWYTRVEMEFDEFEDLDLRSTAAAGFGYYWLKEDDHELKTSLGLGYRHESYDTGRSSDDAVLDLGLGYRKDFGDRAQFTHNLVYSPDFLDFDNYRVQADTALLIPFKDDNLAWKTGVRHKYNSQPPGTNERLDTTYYTSIVLSIK